MRTSQCAAVAQDTKEALAVEDARRRESATKGVGDEGTLALIKNKVKHGYVHKRGRNFPWSYGRRFLVLDGTKSNPRLHYFNGHESKEQ
eukprot:COSAG05_NODE_870_length_6849_cov_43.750519_2_plen_89_part_00